MTWEPPKPPPPAYPSQAAVPPAETGDATGGVIPYKNPTALLAYYIGLFSIIPFFGLVCALVAVPLGIFGLKQRSQRPIIRGGAHAWIGIVLGSLSILVHGLVLIAIVIAATRPRHE